MPGDIVGTAGADNLSGTSGADSIQGLGGNDTLVGGGGSDSLLGGDGDDRLYVDAADALVDGGAGYDTVYLQGTLGIALDLGATNLERVFGGVGADTVTGAGAAAAVEINGGDGNDTVIGGAFADLLRGDAGNDVVDGGDGNDTMDGGTGADVLRGGDGDDRLYVDAADLSVYGGAGYDTAYVEGTAGASLALAPTSLERVFGGTGNDTLTGAGATAALEINGGGGDDTVTGGSGADLLRGDAGNDLVEGGDGNDTMDGGTGADSLRGGAGDDRLYIEAGDALVDGGTGYDTVYVQGAAGVTLDLAAASVERVFGGVGADRFDGTQASAAVEINGGDGNDTLTGGASNDLMRGDAGNDLVDGGDGNDTMDGGTGADSLRGGAGDDRLYIEAGDALVDGGTGYDTVYVQGAAGATLDLAATSVERVFGGTGADTFNGVQALAAVEINGGDGNDTLTGGAFNDLMRGDAGSDLLQGGAGDDRLFIDAADALVDGGTGYDTVYVQGTAGVTLDLAAASIERVFGGTGADRFDGSQATAAQEINGGDGDDTIAGGAGADLLRGDAGNDTLDYGRSATAVTVSLTTNKGTAGAAAGDVLSGFENLTGSAFADTLTGDAKANRLTGGAGDDTLNGGDGLDAARIHGKAAEAVLARTATGWTVTSIDGTDTLTGVEEVQFDDRTVYLDGRNQAPVAAAPLAVTIDEDADPATVDLLDGASDPEGEAVTAIDLTQTGGRAAAVTQAGGALTLDPAQFADLAAGDTETLTFTYGLSDGVKRTEQTLTVTVQGRNDAPKVAAALAAATDEDAAAIHIDLLDGATDADAGAVLAVANVTQTGGPAAVIARSGSALTLDPAQFASLRAGQSAVLTFGYGVSDGTAATPQTLTVTVQGRNDAPVPAAPLAVTAAENAEPLVLDLLQGATDEDAGDSLAVSGFAQTGGRAATVTRTGSTLTLDPAQFADLKPGESAVLTFGYTVGDGVATVPQTLTVTVEGTNAAPVVAAPLTSATNEDAAAVTIDLLNGAADADAGDTLAVADFTQTAGPAATVTRSGSALTLDPAQFAGLKAGQSAVLSFAYAVDDGTDKTPQTLTVTVQGRNDTPVLTAPLTATTTEDSAPLSVDLLHGASDADTGDVLAVGGFTQTAGRAATVTRTDSTLTLDPAQFADLKAGQSAVLTFGYGVGDGTATAAQTLTLTVQGANDAPTVAAPLSVTTTQSTPLTVDLLQGAADVDSGDTLSVANFTQTSGRAATVTRTGSTLTLDPKQFSDLAVGQSAVLTFGYGVSDGTATTPQTLTLTVQRTNSAPVVSGPLSAATDEDAAVLSVNLLQGASDANAGDVLSVANFVQTGGRAATLTRTGSTLTLDPSQFADLAAGQSAVLTFGYGVSDGTAATPQTLTVTVQGRNDAPKLSVPATVQVDEDTSRTLTGLSLADVDAGSGTLQVSLAVDHGTLTFANTAGLTVTQGANGSGALTVTGSLASINAALGTLVYKGVGNYNGADTLRLTASDLGNGNPAAALTDSRTVAVSVASVNDAPVAGADTVSATFGTATTIPRSVLLANDSDPENDAVTLSSIGTATNCSVWIDQTGNVQFTPSGGFSGAASFQYLVTDQKGGVTAGTVTVNVGLNSSGGPGNDRLNGTLGNDVLIGDVGQVGSVTYFGNMSLVTPESPYGDWSSAAIYEKFLEDVNGDGNADLVIVAGAAVRMVFTSMSRGDGTFSPLVYTTPSGPNNTSAYEYLATSLVGDVNGDGFADLVGLGNNSVAVALGNSGGYFGAMRLATPESPYGSWSSSSIHEKFLEDVNGDGKADLVLIDSGGTVLTSMSRGDGTFSPFVSATPTGPNNTSPYEYLTKSLVGDVNGDGYADLIGLGKDSATIALGNSSGYFGAMRLATPESPYGDWSSSNIYEKFLEDVNEDGKADLVIVATGFRLVFSSTSRGDGTFSPYGYDVPSGPNNTSAQEYLATSLVGDVNGDRRADLVGLGKDSVTVAIRETIGSVGADTLVGGTGADTLTGGAGKDTFLYTSPADGLDTVTDFAIGQDKIVIVGSAFGNLPTGALDPLRFALNTAADADDRFIFNTSTGVLSYDADGNGAGAAVDLVTLTGVTNLTASSIQIVAS